MTTHTEILSSAVMTLRERGDQYGPVEECFDRVCSIASVMLNRTVTPYEVAMIEVAVKLGRLQNARDLQDNYIDSINYLAFAAQFISAKPDNATIEDDIAEFAKKYAPKPDPAQY